MPCVRVPRCLNLLGFFHLDIHAHFVCPSQPLLFGDMSAGTFVKSRVTGESDKQEESVSYATGMIGGRKFPFQPLGHEGGTSGSWILSE